MRDAHRRRALQRQDLAPIHSFSARFCSDAKGDDNLVSQVDRLTRPGRAQAAQGPDFEASSHHCDTGSNMRICCAEGLMQCTNLPSLSLSHNPLRALIRRILVRHDSAADKERGARSADTRGRAQEPMDAKSGMVLRFLVGSQAFDKRLRIRA